MYYFIVNIVPADDLTPSGARASAGAVMTKLVSYICRGPALKGLKSK